MIVAHVAPAGWPADTGEAGKVQPSHVVEMAHAVTLSPEDVELLRGPAGPQGPAGLDGAQGPAGPQGPAGASALSEPASIVASTSDDALRITQAGTGNALVVADAASDATPFVIDSAGRVGIGCSPLYAVDGLSISSAASFAPQLFIRNSAGDGAASYIIFEKVRSSSIVQNGDDLGALAFRGFDGVQQINAAFIYSEVDGTPGASDMPGRLVFSTTNYGGSVPTERVRIDSSGNVLVKSAAGLGYGTGAGGTVTQATSKSTAVTLNKPSGQIVMNNAALAAGASVAFTLNNSLIGVSDVVIVSPCGGFSVSGDYSARVGNTQNGAISIIVKNESAGGLSEAVVINFAVIKGAVA